MTHPIQIGDHHYTVVRHRSGAVTIQAHTPLSRDGWTSNQIRDPVIWSSLYGGNDEIARQLGVLPWPQRIPSRVRCRDRRRL